MKRHTFVLQAAFARRLASHVNQLRRTQILAIAMAGVAATALSACQQPTEAALDPKLACSSPETTEGLRSLVFQEVARVSGAINESYSARIIESGKEAILKLENPWVDQFDAATGRTECSATLRITLKNGADAFAESPPRIRYRVQDAADDSGMIYEMEPNFNFAPIMQASLLETEQPQAQPEQQAALPASKGAHAFKPGTRGWLSDAWNEDEPCEGDNGATYADDGSWYSYDEQGRWSLKGKRLTVQVTTKTQDTVSGGPEPLEQPWQMTGELQNATANSFDLITANGKRRHFVRCENYAENDE